MAPIESKIFLPPPNKGHSRTVQCIPSFCIPTHVCWHHEESNGDVAAAFQGHYQRRKQLSRLWGLLDKSNSAGGMLVNDSNHHRPLTQLVIVTEFVTKNHHMCHDSLFTGQTSDVQHKGIYSKLVAVMRYYRMRYEASSDGGTLLDGAKLKMY